MPGRARWAHKIAIAQASKTGEVMRKPGGVFQPLSSKGSLSSDLSTLMKEFSDVVAHHAAAHSDASENPNDFTKSEAIRAIVEVEELVQAALGYKAALLERVEP
ncbi:hypothetical protein [Pseudophaeobacter sp.]|uniref:hypothetical protein n=1 Tax=Pseudophaeobacter sp. TaxID=1971739 RepID=UPI0040582FAC